MVLYKPLNINLYLDFFIEFLSSFLFVVFQICMYLWTACYLILRGLAIYAVIFPVSCNFLHLWGSSILRGCTVVCFFSLLYNISFDVYTKICLSSIQLVDVWVLFPGFCYSKSSCYENSYTCLLVQISKSFTNVHTKCNILSSISLHNARLLLK